MALLESGTSVAQARYELRSIQPPYLLRKFDVTPREYDQITDEDLRCELIDGVLIVHSPASIEHEDRLMFLAILLGNYVVGRGLGKVLGSNAVMEIGERRLCPDLSFLAAAHTGRIRRGKVAGPFDLVIEMVSRSTRLYDFSEKRAAYHDARVPEIWFFDPERKRCVADVRHGRGYRRRTLTRGRLASRAVPGFTIDVTWVWADPLPNPLECMPPGTARR